MAESTSTIRRSKVFRRTLVTARPYRARNGTFHIRRKVPEKLREIVGFTEYKRALGTSDESEAKIRFAAEYARSEGLFESARSELAGRQTVTLSEVQQLAADWLRAELVRLEAAGGFEQYLETDFEWGWEFGDHHETNAEYVPLRRAMAEGQPVPLQEWALKAAVGVFRARGMPPPREGSDARKWAVEAFSGHLLKLSDLAYARYSGDWQMQAHVMPPKNPQNQAPAPGQTGSVAVQSPNVPSLQILFAQYSEQKRLNDGSNRAVNKTLRGFESVMNCFIGLMGDLQISAITRDVASRYRIALARLPKSGKGMRGLSPARKIEKADAENLPRIEEGTIRNHLAAMSVILGYGVQMGLIPENPVVASGVRKAATKAAAKRVAKKNAVYEYSKDELRQIFSGPIFSEQGWVPPRANLGRALYWLPLLLYYTGARREELAQLKVSDFGVSEEGINYINILTLEEKDDDRTVKTLSSRRLIPIHSDLIDRGLINYVDGLPADGYLFPSLRPCPDGYYGTNFGKHWAKYLREVVGLKSSASPVHGFRHTFKTFCRRAEIPEDVQDAITGHAGGSGVSRAYGSMPLSRMAGALCMYPSVADLLKS